MSVEIAWKQNILVTDSNLLKSLLVVFGFGSQAFICGFSRQNICSVVGSSCYPTNAGTKFTYFYIPSFVILSHFLDCTTCIKYFLDYELKSEICKGTFFCQYPFLKLKSESTKLNLPPEKDQQL